MRGVAYLMEDFYKILEVQHNASQEVIKHAYIALSKKYHPDVTKLDPRYATIKMAKINEAYHVLSNPVRRKDYDSQFCSQAVPKNNPSAPHSSTDTENSAIAKKIIELCSAIIEKLDKRIVQKAAFARENKALAMNAAASLDHGLQNLLHNLNLESGVNASIKNIIGLAYWRLAVAFTWANDVEHSEKYIKLAEIFTSKDAPFYGKILHTKQIIKNNRSLYEKSKKSTSRSNVIARLVIAAAAVFFLAAPSCQPSQTTHPTTPSPPTSTLHNSAKPSTQGKEPQTPPPQKPKIQPVARSNVPTHYVEGAEKRNTSGLSCITVDNTQNDMPVYVRIWDMQKKLPIRTFTIAPKQQFTCENISPGIYEVRYKELYQDGDAPKGNKSETISLNETNTPYGTQYDDVSLTLYRVPNGNTQTYAIEGDDV